MNEATIKKTLLEILEDRTVPACERVEAARLLLPCVGLSTEPDPVILRDEETSELMACARLVLDDYRNAINELCLDAESTEAATELADNLEAAITALEGEE